MQRENRVVEILWFCVKFVLFVVVCLVGWWTIMPVYVWLLGHISAAVLKVAFGVPITDMIVKPEGILNTATTMTYMVEGRGRILDVARLVTNVAPFVALVLATPHLTLVRKLKIFAVSAPILALGHATYLIVACALYQRIGQSAVLAQTVVAIGEYIVMTLPFLLWAVLAYGDRIRQLLAAAPTATTKA